MNGTKNRFLLPLESGTNVPTYHCTIDVFPADVTMSNTGPVHLAGAPKKELK
jgi:hypothetical protein